jgi:hypothetical protein
MVQNKTRDAYCQTPGSSSGAACQSTASAANLVFVANPQNIYIYEGPSVNNVRFNVYNNRLTFYSSGESALLYYIVYQMQAF